jgi:hypothetical protein
VYITIHVSTPHIYPLEPPPSNNSYSPFQEYHIGYETIVRTTAGVVLTFSHCFIPDCSKENGIMGVKREERIEQ